MDQPIKEARKAGVSIVLGSDLYHLVPGLNRGEGVLEGLFGLGEAGLSPVEGPRVAASDAAEAIGLGQKTGQTPAEFQGNRIALEGAPLESLQALRHIQMVMRGGRGFVGGDHPHLMQSPYWLHAAHQPEPRS